MIDKQKIEEILKQNVVKISFKKVDGTERQMICSLKEEFLPTVNSNTETKKKTENKNVLPVWDLEKNSFRSFRLESLIDYQIMEQGYEL